MTAYISREAAIKAAMQDTGFKRSHECNAGCARAANNLKAIPATDVAPVVHAEWIVIAEYVDYVSARCGHCRVPQHFYYNKPLTNYCPNCGARMDGGERNAVD